MRRLQTDHLDLWQIHGVTFDNDPDLFIRPNGAAEALTEAKKQGKVRFVGFTGHKDPGIHLKMLATNFPFDTAQMPLNAFDGTFRSFERARAAGVAAARHCAAGHEAAQRPRRGHSERRAHPGRRAALRHEPSGCDDHHRAWRSRKCLRQNLKVAQNFQPMTPAEMQALRDRCAKYGDGRFELYKVSLKFDNPEARLAHGFPLDDQQAEVKQKLKEATNTGKPY